MNQTCKVCGEPAAGFHFGAFTCEGCKSFFGRSYNNLSSISECKNNGKCIIDKKNRTTCKACRLRKCYTVGMSKGGSRYGRRSNWFKIHCLLQEQQQQAVEAAGKVGASAHSPTGFNDMAAAAAQHMQQRNSHMAAAQHMGGLLGYPGYLPEMMQTQSPFMGGRHPADAAAAAAALPFFSMMNSLPNGMGSPQSAFQLPPHLLFPGYHPSAAAAAAADAAYRSEMFKHRQSVDSAASAESQQRYSPAARSHCGTEEEHQHQQQQHQQQQHQQQPPRVPSAADRHSPELCVSGDEDHVASTCGSVLSSHHSNASISPVSAHPIHSPIAIRATPKAVSPVPIVASHHNSPTCSPEPAAATITASLSFSAKMQSLSPVSVCSISAETGAPSTTSEVANDQDCPMDLSMKTSRSSVHSFNTSAGGESDTHSDSSEEEQLRQSQRRKFYHLSSAGEHESDDASSDATSHEEAVKRQKISAEAAAAAVQSYNGFAHNAATSLRGIFVCV